MPTVEHQITVTEEAGDVDALNTILDAFSGGYTVETFADLADLTPAQVAVGELVNVRETGAVFRHVNTGWNLDYSATAGVKLQVLKGDVRAFGAVCDGVTDDTAAVQAAWTAGVASYPVGTCLITDTISGTDLFLHLTGESQGSVILFRPATARPLFSLVRTRAESAFLTTSNIRITTDVASAGYAIQIRETRTGTGDEVVGGVDFLHVEPGTIFEGTGSGYWRGPINVINAGGVYWNGATARNDNDHAAQADNLAKGIYFVNDETRFLVIRALHMDNFYLQRFYTGITLNTVRSIESLYLGNGEIVGAFRGIVFEGGGNVDAIHIGATHLDVLAQALYGAADTEVNLIRVIGADLRKGTNGGAATAGNLIDFSRGEMLSVSGCLFNGDAANKATSPQNGIRLSGTFFRFSIGGSNVFRNLNTPVVVAGTANTGSIGGYTATACDFTLPSITTSGADTVGFTTRWTGMSALFYKTADQVIANNVQTKLTWADTVNDDLGMLVSAGADAITIPAGVAAVKIAGSVWMQDAATGALTLQIRKNGGDVRGGGYRKIDLASANEDAVQVTSGVINVTAGDLIELSVIQTSGADLSVNGAAGARGFHTWLSVEVVK